MHSAIGLIETKGLIGLVEATDAMAKAANVFPIVGGRKIEHLHDNIKALSIRHTREQIEYLESVQPFDIGFPVNFIGRDPSDTGEIPPLVAMSGNVDVVRNPKPVGYE